MQLLLIGVIFLIIFILFIKAPRFEDNSSEQKSAGEERKRRRAYRDNYTADGFLNPQQYPVALTDHARVRMRERIHIYDRELMEKYACDAYQYGKSARQLNQSAAYRVRQIEQKEGSIVLLYKNYIYIFSKENVLITMYENENIKI